MSRSLSFNPPLRTVIRALLAVVVGLGVLLGAAVAAAPSASAATTSGTVTYSAQLDIPAPPSSNFAGSSGGDGWAVAMTPTAVYNVFHHALSLQVTCHLQSDASACWPSGAKTIVDGSGNNFTTSIGPGLYIDQATGKLYVYAVRATDQTAGVVCIDTTLPAADTGAQLFCGFTPLGGVGESPGGDENGLSAPVQVGTNWYSFNEVEGAGTGTENKLLCFDLVTKAACASQPYAVNLGSDSFGSIGYSDPIGVSGTDIILQVVGATTELTCFDTVTDGACAGSWPVAVDGAAGAPFPLLNATGTPIGVCDPITGNPCFLLDGSSTPTPPGMTAAIGQTVVYNGPSVTIGARVYVPNADTNEVDCYDYSAQAECANFPKAFSGLDLLYTVNPDPQRPTCLWVNSDNGVSQIQNFDAYTGGACGQGPVRVLASSLVAPNNDCIPANYTSLQVLVPSPSQYSSGSVQFEDFDGNPISSIPQQPLDATGSVNLAQFNLTTLSPLPQFLVTLNNAGSPPEVDVKLTWTGTYSTACTSGGQQVAGGQGYRLSAADGGVFDFGTSAFYGSMTGKHLNGPEVGIASTPDGQGYWLAASDGGVFAFGDAQYQGGLGANVHLNSPIVGIAASPTGSGYWLVAADGGVFAYGSAVFHGSGSGAITAPVVGIAATPTGGGYWLVSSDGNVYPFGDAVSYGSEHGHFLNGKIVGITGSPDGKGYTLVGADGGVFAFGDAPFLGSMYGHYMAGPAVGITETPSGDGYWLDAADGGVFAFGDAQFLGCMVGSPLNATLDSISG